MLIHFCILLCKSVSNPGNSKSYELLKVESKLKYNRLKLHSASVLLK